MALMKLPQILITKLNLQMTLMKLPQIFWNKGSEVCVPDVGSFGRESQQTPGFHVPVRNWEKKLTNRKNGKFD